MGEIGVHKRTPKKKENNNKKKKRQQPKQQQQHPKNPKPKHNHTYQGVIRGMSGLVNSGPLLYLL